MAKPLITPIRAIVSYRHLKNLGGFSRIRTHDLCDAGAMLYQLNYVKPFGWEEVDCKTVVFLHFRMARGAVSVILACEAREPHTHVGRVRRETSPHSPSPFLHSLQTFRLNIILPCRLRSQKNPTVLQSREEVNLNFSGI